MKKTPVLFFGYPLRWLLAKVGQGRKNRGSLPVIDMNEDYPEKEIVFRADLLT